MNLAIRIPYRPRRWVMAEVRRTYDLNGVPHVRTRRLREMRIRFPVWCWTMPAPDRFRIDAIDVFPQAPFVRAALSPHGSMSVHV